jgi:spermidine synthase
VGCAIALLPAAVLSSTTTAGLALAGCVASALALVELATRSAVAEQALGASTEPVAKKFERLLLAIPCGVSLFECVRFATVKSSLPAVSLHGYLPFVAAAVVCVIALSAALVSALRNELTLLSSAMQLSIASSTLVGYLFQDEIPYVFARLVSALDDLPDHVALVRFFMFFTAGLCTLPATLGMGAMFPITMRLCSGGGREVGRDVAVVYSANTLGSIAGAWLPGFVLMPLLGIERTLHAGMLLNVGLAAIMLLASRLEGSQRERELHAGGERDEAVDAASGSTAGALSVTLHLATLVCAALLIWLAAGPSSALRWNLSHMTLGAFRVSLARNVLDPVAWGEPDLVYYRDGLSTTVSVERWGRHLSLKNNGKVDASNGDDMPTQIAVAAYPLLLHASHGRGIDVAIVGFGSGVTVGAALQFPLEKLDAMELERGVVEAAARFFADVNHLPHAQATFPFVRAPRLSLTNDDGRNYLSATDQTYDVIISEPSNPWITGVSDLFTVEHFQVSKRKLRPGGMYCQWVQLYEMSPSNVKTIYRTFASQFRYVVAFSAEELSSDTILIGSDSPIPLDVRALAEAMQPAAVQKELRRAFIDTPYDVLARLLFVSKEEILAFAQLEERERDGRFVLDDTAMGDGPCPAKSCRRRPAPLNTDDNMWIELRAPADLIGFARYQGYLRLFYGDAFPYGALLSKVTGLDTDERKAALAEALLAHGRKRRASELVKTLRASDARGVQDVARMTALFAADAPSPALTLPQGAMGPQLPEGLARELASVDALGARYVAEGQPGKALALLEALDPAFSSQRGPAARAAFGVLCYVAAKGDRDRLRRAVQEIETAAREAPELLEQHPELWYVLARAHDALASFHRATDSMRAYVTRMAH